MTRPLPPIPYTGPIRTPHHPYPVASLPPVGAPLGREAIPYGTPSPILKRRPHTRRLGSGPSLDLPSVTEEEETEVTMEKLPQKPKKPRPIPLIPSRKYSPSGLPLIVEIPEYAGTLDRPISADEYESFALSPSTLLNRRRSETILDFPIPPLHALPMSSSPFAPSDNSPTHSNTSMSSASSSPPPLTPQPSEAEDDDVRPHVPWVDERSPRVPYRSPSVVSLRSFNTAEFDAQAEGICAMLHPQREKLSWVPDVRQRESLGLPVPEQSTSPSSRLVLSVLNTSHGGSFDVPLVLGSFLSLPSSPASSEAPLGDHDTECEGIPTSWSDSESDDFGTALPSSEDDASDNEGCPSRCLDPAYYAKLRRRIPRNGGKSPVLPSLPMLEPLHVGPDTPSAYSMDSPVDCPFERPPPRKSLVPSDVVPPSIWLPHRPEFHALPTPPRATSPLRPSPTDSPVLRSRFSSSTLDSLPPQPSSTTQAFFARLAARVKPSSRSKSERPDVLVTRLSLRRRHVPASPALGAFSFSSRSSSRSSLDSADSSSLFSNDSTSSSGLNRPPIPVELFLRE